MIPRRQWLQQHLRTDDLCARTADVNFDGATSGKHLPAFDGRIDIARIKLDQTRLASGLLSSDQGGADAAEGIQDDSVAMGAVPDRVGNKGDRLCGRVQRQLALLAVPLKMFWPG
jgi:hypothetical protein